jgi:hypothetical protein
MPRNRTIYNNQAVFVGPTPATGSHAAGIVQLHRIQSVSHGFELAREDVNQFGQLAAIDRIVLDSPTVNLDFSYFISNGVNESRLGFNIGGGVSAASGLLDGTEDEKNYFILTAPEGLDAATDTNVGTHGVYAIGNGFISNYSAEASVGDIPTATVTVEGLNVNYNIGSSGQIIPAVNPEDGTDITAFTYTLPTAASGIAGQPTALAYGDITLSIPDLLGAKVAGNGKAHIQSFTLDLPIARTPLNRLGSRFAFKREIDFPVTATASITANVSDLTTGRLSNLVRDCSESVNNLIIVMKECDPLGAGAPVMEYYLNNARLDSEAFDASIGPSESVTLTFSSQVSAANDTVNGVFMSGAYTP